MSDSSTKKITKEGGTSKKDATSVTKEGVTTISFKSPSQGTRGGDAMAKEEVDVTGRTTKKATVEVAMSK